MECERLVHAVIDGNLRHRKGWHPSDRTAELAASDLVKQTTEIVDALSWDDNERARAECGAVLNSLFGVTIRLGLSLEDVCKIAAAQTRRNFPQLGPPSAE